MPPETPTFDLVVATVGRTDELGRLLRSLDHQTHTAFRVLVVDQNPDDRLEPVLAGHPGLEVLRLRSEPGLSRARNAAAPHLQADVVGWPDDDCFYPDSLLADVAGVFRERPWVDGVSGQAADPHGRPSGRWGQEPCEITPDTVWNRATSHTIFLRRHALEAAGLFDEAFGLGSGTPWHSGEEIELLVRAMRGGARVLYEPAVVILHPAKASTPDQERALARRDGASVGYILARHRYGSRMLARMATRPIGGAALALLHRNPRLARMHLDVLRGRLAGYRAGRAAAGTSSRSSANNDA